MLANPSQIPTKQVAERLQLTAFSSASSTRPSSRPLPLILTSTPSSSTTPEPVSLPPSPASQDDMLYSLCRDAIIALPDEVEAVRKGHRNVLNKIVGRVMKESRGRADARTVRVLLEELVGRSTEQPK
jgi:aspartyl-tRNA(Asn)/glutamyl-tRNA(Gln) amidotransferase subunit B